MTVTLRRLEPGQVAEWSDEIVDTYREAFTAAPWNAPPEQAEAFRADLPAYAADREFRLTVALEDGGFAGFALGSAAEREFWEPAVARWLGSHAAAEWTNDAFVFFELAVREPLRGRGIGAALYDDVMSNVPCETALLTTNKDALPARGLYEGRGWKTLHKSVVLFGPPTQRPQLLLGLRL